MRALYICGIADPWIRVAETLQSSLSITPVYWLGASNDDSQAAVERSFPQALYHPYFDAWRGVFPGGVESDSYDSIVDPELYGALSGSELQALHLMDRMDFSQSDFSYPERRLLFRKFLRCWSYIIDQFKIDVVISPNVPHRSFDFPLYLLCRNKRIPVLSFVSTPFMNAARIIPVNDVYSMPEHILHRFLQKRKCEKFEPLADDIQQHIDRIRQDYDRAKPESFKESGRHHKKKPSILLTARKFMFELFDPNSSWLGRRKFLRKGVPSYHKLKNRDVEEAKTRRFILPYMNKMVHRIRYLKKLQAEYRRLTTKADLSRKYVYVALHYQPEATTSPKAGIYADQLYLLELISHHLPRDWAIYVKENPKQFNPIGEGNTARPLRFYRDALKIPRVQLLAVDSNPFDLIDHSLAVFSLAGTVGWEGMVRGKPVVCFGPSWYEYFTPGVMRVQNSQDWLNIRKFIEDYVFSEIALQQYLKAIEETSLCAYFRAGLKNMVDIDEESCIKALSSALADQLERM